MSRPATKELSRFLSGFITVDCCGNFQQWQNAHLSGERSLGMGFPTFLNMVTGGWCVYAFFLPTWVCYEQNPRYLPLNPNRESHDGKSAGVDLICGEEKTVRVHFPGKITFTSNGWIKQIILGFPSMGVPNSWMLCNGKSENLKWMISGYPLF